MIEEGRLCCCMVSSRLVACRGRVERQDSSVQAKLKERDGSVDAELRDVFEVMKLSEEKKMERVKRDSVCLEVVSCGREKQEKMCEMCLAGE